MRPRALDLFCRAGGISEGLRRAGFDVTGVDILDCSKAYNRGPGSAEHENPARFVQADALTFPLEGYDLIFASPPCQAHSTLRHLVKGKEYPDLIGSVRERLVASGVPWAIENVPGAPLAADALVLCGTMFGLGTADGRAELRRHRRFETSFPVLLRPACRHGQGAISISGHTAEISRSNWGKRVITVSGDRPNSSNTPRVICVAGGKAMAGGMMIPQGELKRRTISVMGDHPQSRKLDKTQRETFSTADARVAMGIPWMAMKDLSQAIPPAYSEFLGLLFLGEDPRHLLVDPAVQWRLF